MEENKFLNEEKFKKVEKKISFAAFIVFVIGICIGGFLIYNGVAKPDASKIEELERALKNKKSELEEKGVVYDPTAKYTDGEVYDLQIITDALDPSFSHCSFDEYKNNALTKEYCAVKNSTDDYATSTKIGLGTFICIATCIISGFIFLVSKQRNILAFQAQQLIPIAKEGVDEMAPAMGNLAREVTKGRKEGEENAMVAYVVKCKHCGADNEIIGKTGVCEYCKSKISYED